MKTLTDEELFSLAKKYGQNALLWRRKFIGLLPEVYRRRLWEKKRFGSIFEFASKLCGLSHEQVRLTLNLEKRFQETPKLHELLVRGEVSVNKLARVVSIASSENEEELAMQVQILSQKAVETVVRDFKNENGLSKPKERVKSLRAQTFEMSEKLRDKLDELAEKGLDVNDILLDLLQKREEDIQQEKDEVSSELKISKSRYIPVKVRGVLQKEHGSKCAVPDCQKSSVHLHHTARFSLSKSHNPHFLAPLCKEHHEIAHAVDLRVLEKRF